jgi:hypothetical protein
MGTSWERGTPQSAPMFPSGRDRSGGGRDTYGSMASAAIGNPEASPGGRFFDRSDHTSPGRRPHSIHGNVTFPASTRRSSKTRRDPFAASSMTAQSRCSSSSLPPLMAHNKPALPE